MAVSFEKVTDLSELVILSISDHFKNTNFTSERYCTIVWLIKEIMQREYKIPRV